jgi:YD repeat-containing protein
VRKALAAAILGALSLVLSAQAVERVETVQGKDGSKELVYRDESLVEERSLDERGALLEERFFDASSLPVEKRAYIRAQGRLVKVEASDSAGQVTGTRSYHYDLGGKLVGTSSEGSLGTGAAGMLLAGSSPQGSWTSDTLSSVQGYDDQGRVNLRQITRDGKPVSIERMEYWASGAIAATIVEVAATGLVSETRFDEAGKMLYRTETPVKGLAEKTEYRYDDQGRLSEELRRRGAGLTRVTKAYGEDGKLAREETLLDGELLRVVEQVEGGRVEELYEDGLLFVRATYREGRKVLDEFFADGELVRTREYR